MLEQVRDIVLDDRPLEQLMGQSTPRTAGILEHALGREELSEADGEHLLGVEGPDLRALIRVADMARAADVGPEVTYVVNRNINWTNVCFVGCQFCGFARHRKDGDAYNHSIADILSKVQDAVERGATEVCMQAGINPEMDKFAYRDLLVGIKSRFPDMHIHAFSPMEIMYGARRAGMNYREYLTMLRDAGLGTIPGTAAEILDDEVRELLSHKKVDVRTWVEIITTAHELGIRTSSTIMYGHVEKPHHIVRHTALMRSIQKQTGGFTEFVPLRFVHTETELFRKGLVGEPPPRGTFDLRLYAFARLMLRGWIDNLQTSWVKLGAELAQFTLHAGCNDFGGTLMEESITKAAGGDEGEYLPAEEIRALISAAGRVPVERTTTYGRRARNGTHATGDGAGWRSRGSALSPGALSAS